MSRVLDVATPVGGVAAPARALPLFLSRAEILALGNTEWNVWPPRALVPGRPFKSVVRLPVDAVAVPPGARFDCWKPALGVAEFRDGGRVLRVRCPVRLTDYFYMSEPVRIRGVDPVGGCVSFHYTADEAIRTVFYDPGDLDLSGSGLPRLRMVAGQLPEKFARAERLEVMSITPQAFAELDEEDAAREGAELWHRWGGETMKQPSRKYHYWTMWDERFGGTGYGLSGRSQFYVWRLEIQRRAF